MNEIANPDILHTIGIGFGDRDNPKPSGRGLMFFDDIRLVLQDN